MILLEQLAIDRRRNIRAHDLLPSARSNQPLDHARTHLRDLARWQQKNGCESRREVAIDVSHEALVFEIRAGANPSEDMRRADGARVVDEVFVLEGIDAHMAMRLRRFGQHRQSLGVSERVALVRISSDRDDKGRKKLRPFCDHPHVSNRERIEAPGIDADDTAGFSDFAHQQSLTVFVAQQQLPMQFRENSANGRRQRLSISTGSKMKTGPPADLADDPAVPPRTEAKTAADAIR